MILGHRDSNDPKIKEIGQDGKLEIEKLQELD